MTMPTAQQKKTRGVYEKLPGSGVWWVRYADSNGKIRREKAGTLSSARQLYGIRRAASWQGFKLPHTVKSKLTFAMLAKDAQAHLLTQNRTGGDSDRIKLLVEVFGEMLADAIKPQDIEQRLNKLAEDRKWKPGTTNRHKAVLSMVYRLAVKNGRVAMNPARLVSRLHEDNSVIRFLSLDEQKRLKSAVELKHPERWAIITLALNLGVRAGELWGLKWSEVDRASASPRVTLLDTKNGSIRYVPLNADALAALTLLEKIEPETPYVVPRQHYRVWFDLALKAATIDGFTWHCLRHTFASRLVMAGVDIRTVADLMGHKTIQMTMRYAHLSPQHQADAVSKLVSFGTSTLTDTASASSS